jgi:hypothetical protein
MHAPELARMPPVAPCWMRRRAARRRDIPSLEKEIDDG